MAHGSTSWKRVGGAASGPMNIALWKLTIFAEAGEAPHPGLVTKVKKRLTCAS